MIIKTATDTYIYKRSDNADFVLKRQMNGKWQSVVVGDTISIQDTLYKVLTIAPNEVTMSYVEKIRGTDHKKKEKV